MSAIEITGSNFDFRGGGIQEKNQGELVGNILVWNVLLRLVDICPKIFCLNFSSTHSSAYKRTR
jgi:hypothetical protein